MGISRSVQVSRWHSNVGVHIVVCASICLPTSVYVCPSACVYTRHQNRWPDFGAQGGGGLVQGGGTGRIGWCIYKWLFGWGVGVCVWRFLLISKRHAKYDMGTHRCLLTNGQKGVCACVQHDV